jgi:hypothetical protein
MRRVIKECFVSSEVSASRDLMATIARIARGSAIRGGSRGFALPLARKAGFLPRKAHSERNLA